jgi:hypothetical protein
MVILSAKKLQNHVDCGAILERNAALWPRHIMLRDLITQKVTDFGYPRSCRKHQIENRFPLPGACSTNCFQNVIHKMWPKLAKIDRFSTFFWQFSHFSGRGTQRIQSKIEFYEPKMTFRKKLGEQAPGTYFQFDSLGYPISVTFFLARTFGLTSPSA